MKSTICLRLALRPLGTPLRNLRGPSQSQKVKGMITYGTSSTIGQRHWVNGTRSRISAPCAFISFVHFCKAFRCLVSLIWLADTGLDYLLPLLTPTSLTLIQSQRMRLMRTPTVCFLFLILQLRKINLTVYRGRVLQE